ncbi:hypothetical protein WJX81_003455 [Elliptochloris bilobata]|uniref:Endonuclease/exonuclease/phosphatase domain-containing protein n=1 Tax=Elliptochloris bilobata TaxID=381761 RepID=A0AAW1RPG8_9CHLO
MRNLHAGKSVLTGFQNRGVHISRTTLCDGDSPVPAPAKGRKKRKSLADPPSADEAARRWIMGHAQQVNGGASNSLLAELHAARTARRGPPDAGTEPSVAHQVGASASGAAEGASALSLLTWNLWFAEDVELEVRMAAVGHIIDQIGGGPAGYPTFLCFQEVTENIYALLSSKGWWRRYVASPVPYDRPYFTALLHLRDAVQHPQPARLHDFSNSVMGRGLQEVGGEVCGRGVRVATTHLESPCGWNQLYSKPRVAQCKEALAMLGRAQEPNLVFLGDMNWGAPEDGEPPLPPGWVDVWEELHAGDPGLTYDPKANPMLGPYNRIRKRLDRVFARLAHWRPARMRMVGTQPIAGASYVKTGGKRGPLTLPVLPSDHFGLHVELEPI